MDDSNSNSSVQNEDLSLEINFYEIIFYEYLKKANCKKSAINYQAFIESFKTLLEFYLSIQDWTKIRDLINQIDHFFDSNPSLISNYKQDEFYRIIGDFFYSIQQSMNALFYYKKSVKLSNEENLMAIESFENLLNLISERWHYRMINDKVRNKAFSLAIKKKINQIYEINKRCRILDIGTGTGLLSAQCFSHFYEINSSYSNLKLYSCEKNQLFYNIAREFLKPFPPNSLKLIEKHSNDLNINKDLDGSKVDFIVSEIFDDGLLGEGCLETFYNALIVNNLINLDNHSAKIIPKSANIYISAIECEYLRNSNYFSNQNIKTSCLDNSHKFEENKTFHEPYTTENLDNLDFKYLTDPIKLDEFNIEFDNLAFLEKYCKLNHVTSINKNIQIKSDGQLDAFVLWFDLHLDDEISINNAPSNINSLIKSSFKSPSWHQAIYNIPFEFKVSKDQNLLIKISLSKDCILIKHEFSQNDSINSYLTRNEISLLNNFNYQNFYLDWIEKYFYKLVSTNKLIKIGVLTSNISLFLLKIFETGNCNLNTQLYLITRDKDEEKKYEFFKKKYKFSIISIDETREKKSVSFDILILEPIDCNFGTLKKNILPDILLIKNLKLNKDSIIFPDIIQLKGVLIDSDNIVQECELISNDNLYINRIKNLDLVKTLKEYRVRNQLSLNIKSLSNYKQLTQVENFLNLDLRKLKVSSINIENKQISLKCINKGSIIAFLYWFEMSSNISKKFYYTPFDSKDSNQFAAIYFLDNNLKNRDIGLNENINVNFTFKNDIFDLKIN